AQTTEITSAAQTTEITSAAQTTEITSAAQTTEITSAAQTTEITSAAQTTEITSAAQTTEITSAAQTTEITSAAQTTEITSAAQTTEITSAAQTTEITSAAQTTEITSATTEITSAAQTTEITSAAQTTEITSAAQTTEITSAAQTTEITSAAQTTEITSAAQTTEITSAAQTTEITSAAQTTEITSAAQTTEITSAAQTTEITSAAQTTEITSAAQTTEITSEESSRQIASGDREPLTPHPAPPREYRAILASRLMSHSDPTDHCHSPSIASQASASLAMDSVGHKDPAAFDPNVLSQSDDDFMFETKKSPFQAFPPMSDGFGETTAARRSVEVSESPSPDLVQDAYDEDTDADAPVSLSHAPSHLFSEINTTSDDRPTSLPDILKSSPLNPDKLDSGSSEESPDFSPVHRSMDDSPNSPFPVNSPIGFDSKILLLKEMTEETEARAVEKAKLEAEQSFAAFDLVKETNVPPKSDGLLKDKEDAEVFSQTAVQTSDRFECLSFPSGTSREPSDSESQSADSFSPVLDAVTQDPSSFSVEQERRAIQGAMEAAEEVSEQEVSSEEFEFVERPPRGASEEFLEMQDSLAFIKPSEMLQDEDRSPKLEPQEAADHMPATEDAENQSSYHLLTQASDKPSPARGKAGLESDLQEICPAPEEAEVVLELLYWRDVRSSGLLFGCSLFLLLSLLSCSIISVLSYSTLALLSVTVSFRTYRGVLQAVQKSDEGHPFKQYLEKDVALSKDVVQRHSDAVLSRIDGVLKELRRLFLVEDLIDSLKFAVFLWVLTYVGAWFNGLTLLILGLIGAFSGPVVYEKHQVMEKDVLLSLLFNRGRSTRMRESFYKVNNVHH
uniref:Reticulon n=1 Tax=Sinocyclocheilus anshuiensis TaxID=1608454 RepID=A0A671N225_9TELE